MKSQPSAPSRMPHSKLSPWRRLLRFFGRSLLNLRYQVELKGAENLIGLTGPVLVLPNHPGYIDPAILLTQLGRYLQLRPLVFEDTYRNPLVYPIMLAIDALEVPDLQQQSKNAKDQTEELLNRVEAGLKRGEAFLIYPSGRLQRSGVEVVGAARAASDILTRCPETKVILVQTQGVWGSMFSFAQTGKLPDLNACAKQGLWHLLTNLIFFAPRRKVTITVQRADFSSLSDFSREQLNPFLEKWYNKDTSSKPVFVPYHFAFGPKTFDFPPLQSTATVPLDKIKKSTREGVAEILQEKLKRPLTEAESAGDYPLEKFGFDSLERMDVALAIEQRFGFHSNYVANTMVELWALAQGLIEAGDEEPLVVPNTWNRSALDENPNPLEIKGETILEALGHQALNHWKEVCAADDLAGAVTYEQFIWRAQLLAEKIEGGEDHAVGLMLPASVAANILFFALHFAGKLPVLLNWTTGPANLATAARTMKLKRVITSRRFLDRLGISIEGVEFIYLEDLAASISKPRALIKLLTLRLNKSGAFKKSLDPRQPAVVLFTSGSEKAPKAVPLSHTNLLFNVRASIGTLDFKSSDALLGFLPPFHSFGLTGNILLPLLSGIRVIYHADPTDAHGLVRKIVAYRPTLLFSTPTFVSYILNRAQPGELASLRYLVTGAEKCPASIFDLATELAPQASIFEGYGITECSPVISANSPGKTKRGSIGQPLDGLQIRIVDPNTLAPLPSGETGLLLVHGPSIFDGYLGYDGPSPFVEQDGKRWYNTGDLVKIDAEGFILFAGRMKRFIKAGGEMISLPALEEVFSIAYPPQEEGPRVAVEGIELPDGGRRIALFTKESIPLSDANRLLTDAGFRGIMRLDEVIRIEKIPVLGTGKTDYKILRASLEKKNL